jgi:hypothetical protein
MSGEDNAAQNMTKNPFECADPNNPSLKEMFEALKFIGGFSDRVRIVEVKQQQIQEDLEVVQEDVSRIDVSQNNLRSKMMEMELEPNWLKQENLKRNITLAGIPAKNDDYVNCLNNIGDRIGMNNLCANVRRVTCMTRKGSTMTKTLLVEFVNLEAKEQFMQKKRKMHPIFPQQVNLGEAATPLGFRDHLTKYFMEIYKEAATVKEIINKKKKKKQNKTNRNEKLINL